MSVAEMKMLKWMNDNTLRDRIRNEYICRKLQVTPIENKMRENRLRWFGYVQCRPINMPIPKSERIIVNGAMRTRGRSKQI